MVVGAGIGGMQSAIDLADSGLKVYLVEKNSAIGGRMAQLDKTFPTNDCAMCIISPKLLAVGAHPNIEILTKSDVKEVTGEPGNFKVTLRQKARYIDMSKCTACGECAKVCPEGVFNAYNMNMDTVKAVNKMYPQAIPGAYAIDKRGTSPCRDACPAHTACQGYVALTAEGRFEEALEVIRRDLPLPAICGRVCPHPCETACNRGNVDKPVAIRDIKRFLADYENEHKPEPPMPELKDDSGKKVAIIGGGPAGLSAAFFLRLEGHDVTIFEAMPKAGGMLRYGIPDYRLPQDVLDREVSYITRLGVKIEYGVRIGKERSIDSLMKEGFDAVFVGIGAQDSTKLPLPGAEAQGVWGGVDFLRDVNQHKKPEIGKRVVVIGGGAVAVDVARSALRLGAEDVQMFCLEQRDEMPAWEEEVRAIDEEKIGLNNGWGPKEFKVENGKVVGATFKQCLRVFDENGRFSPEYKEDNLTELEADTVILAIGQRVNLGVLEGTEGVELTERGLPKADKTTLQTSKPGVFIGGDAFTGPSIAIDAVATGREAAVSIDRMFKGQDLSEGRETHSVIAPMPDDLANIELTKRYRPHELPASERVTNFNEVEAVMSEAEAIAEAKRCLSCGVCSECLMCVSACKAEAINHDDMDRDVELEVGSLILAPGYEQFEPERVEEFGYGRWSNVITGLEFERMLSATGPSKGHLFRPSDHEEPKRVAWIQCVGSRDVRNSNYCSGVCCMFATKEAIIAKEHAGDAGLDATIFYMDMRATGKGFDQYVDNAKNRYGVRYVRSMVSRVDEVPETKDVEITYVDDMGKMHKEQFDILVLSVGLKPSREVMELAKRLDVDVDQYGFARTSTFQPLATSRPGIFVSGVWQGPKDIPETVAQASAAAAYAERATAAGRGTLLSEKNLPDERDVSSEEERIGVWVCNCGINIGSVVNVPEVADYAGTIPGVVHAQGCLFACSQDNQELMKEVIKEKGLNRIVVSSCTPRTHEPLFQNTLQATGLNPYMFSMANIREHCSWVHASEPQRATTKAKELVHMAVENAKQLKQLYKQDQTLVHSCLVIGGGVAGMTAAMELALQGFDVAIIEKTDRLGGKALKKRWTHDGEDVQAWLKDLIAKVEANDKITVYLNAQLYKYEGFLGNFKSQIKMGTNGDTRMITIEHGASVIAIGAEETKPTEYGYGELSGVQTLLDLEQEMADKGMDNIGDVALIQCVGSRNEERPWCSKVCCTQSLQLAIRLKDQNPKRNVAILFREMRSYSLKERFYAEARRKGVLFVRYDEANPPQVEGKDGRLEVTVNERGKRTVKLVVDRLGLAAAIQPPEANDLANQMKIPRTTEGFMLEVHQKLGPLDFASDGMYLAGLAHMPKPLEETITQAAGAASRAATVLSKEVLKVGGVISVVDPDRCAVCLCCVRACPFDVPVIDNEIGAAYINPAECRGCGVCASECPGKAIQLQHFTDNQIRAMINVFPQHKGM